MINAKATEIIDLYYSDRFAPGMIPWEKVKDTFDLWNKSTCEIQFIVMGGDVTVNVGPYFLVTYEMNGNGEYVQHLNPAWDMMKYVKKYLELICDNTESEKNIQHHFILNKEKIVLDNMNDTLTFRDILSQFVENKFCKILTEEDHLNLGCAIPNYKIVYEITSFASTFVKLNSSWGCIIDSSENLFEVNMVYNGSPTGFYDIATAVRKVVYTAYTV